METKMRAFTIEGAGRTLPDSAKVSDTAPSRALRRFFARVFRGVAFVLLALTAVTTILALRHVLWAIGHPEQPFFRELSKLWS
jgi:hypothetical protein